MKGASLGCHGTPATRAIARRGNEPKNRRRDSISIEYI